MAMNDEGKHEGIYVDSDWKTEAAREKERLAKKEKEERAGATDKVPADAAAMGAFADLVNLLALQVVAALGGIQGPGGERIPPNPAGARHMIDLLEVLEQKTRGNLTDDEKRLLDSILYELRLQYVQTATATSGASPAKPR